MDFLENAKRSRLRVLMAFAEGRIPGVWHLKRLRHTLLLPFGIAAATVACIAVYARHKVARRTGRVSFVGRTRRLGDLIALEPVSRQLLAEAPDSTIAWLVEPEFAAVVRLFPAVRYVVKVPCETALAFLRRLFGRNSVLLFHFAGSHCPLCFFPPSMRPHDPSVTLENYFRNGRSLLTAFTQIAGVKPKLFQPMLRIPPYPDGQRQREPYLVLHGGPTEREKEWRPERWKLLVERLLAEQEGDVVMVGTRRIVDIDHPRFHDRTGRQRLGELAATIAGAKLFVGIDSVPSHLANAYKVRGVLLSGAYRGFETYCSYSGFYAEPGNLTTVRGAPGTAEIEVEAVLAGIAAARD